MAIHERHNFKFNTEVLNDKGTTEAGQIVFCGRYTLYYNWHTHTQYMSCTYLGIEILSFYIYNLLGWHIYDINFCKK